MKENEKNEKNEKMNFFLKVRMEKNDEKTKENEKLIHTQNPRQFPGFTVIVVTFRENPQRFP